MVMLVALALGFMFTASAATAEPSLSVCAFAPAGAAWVGSCGRIDGQDLRITLARASAVTSGVWREGPSPVAVWAGTSKEADGTTYRVELETYADRSGTLRTEYGWFPVTSYAATASALEFRIDAVHETPPNALDRRIVDRADALLSSNAAWNRRDNRRCPAAATTLSIYCAMERAEIDVTGGFHHRRPAMEVVREIIDKRTAARRYDHRLMDYNNDRTTTLDDVRSLFAEARAQMR